MTCVAVSSVAPVVSAVSAARCALITSVFSAPPCAWLIDTAGIADVSPSVPENGPGSLL